MTTMLVLCEAWPVACPGSGDSEPHHRHIAAGRAERRTL